VCVCVCVCQGRKTELRILIVTCDTAHCCDKTVKINVHKAA